MNDKSEVDSARQALEACKSALAKLGSSERTRFQKQISFIEKRLTQSLPVDKKLNALVNEVHKLSTNTENKKKNIGKITFPEGLPVSERADEIAEIISKNQVVILAGETGSGKTTQIPKICLQLGMGINGLIGHTQPRRIAARTVASRIAEELGVELGSTVGYQVRFTDHSDDTTAVKLMTDGILLAEIQHDPLLSKYDALIIDEAHERSLNIDFLLGYIKQILPRRPDLKIIVTSATIDLERFSEHFDKAPVIEVSGRTYPVETRYRPWQEDADDVSQAILAALDEILIESKGKGGDVLVFLSGEREIRETNLAIKKANIPGIEVLPLYARLSLPEQNKVFQSRRGRKIVLSTNVAETSLTVPGIRYVIDTGVARISRYSLRTKVQRLPIEAISQASANQRQGRCGRVSDGICYRLYSEDDFNSRPAFTDAEILRTNLAAVVLQMLQMKMGKIEHFPFVDKPDKRLINDGYKLLEELRAVSPSGKITSLGRQFYRLSVDPKFARMIVESGRLACLNEILIIVAALTIQDPRERPADKKQAADEKHRRFWHEQSDFYAYVNLWEYVEQQRQELSQSQFRKLCKKEFLNFMRLKEWRELHHQLKIQVKTLGLKLNQEPASFDAIHQALLVGLLSNIGKKEDEEKDKNLGYEGTRSRKFKIFPGSSLKKKKLNWLMASDFIETSQLFAHCVAKVDVKWVLSSAEHLIKNTYFEPHYDAKSGSVKAFAKKSLWGLVLVEKQRLDYSSIDPELCREVFIRSALVEGRYRGKGHFFSHNRKLIDDVSHLEAKARRRDILVDDEHIFNFYNDRVPEKITNLAGFEHWRKETEHQNEKLLFLAQSDVMLHGADNVSEEQFPNTLKNGDLYFPVRYEFEPTRTNDGLNVMVPVDLLHQVDELQLQWLVPGLLRDKCIALVKTLPKTIRKNLVPVPTYVDRALAKMKPSSLALTEALAEQLSIFGGVTISEDAWQLEKLDHFYSTNIVLVDAKNKIIDQSRNLSALRAEYKTRVQSTLEDIGSDLEKTGLIKWDFDHLPSDVELKRGAVKVKAFPALVIDSKKKSADIRLFDNPIEAEVKSYRGACQLALNEMGQTVKYIRKDLLRGKDIGLSLVKLGSRDDVAADILLAACRRACFTTTDLGSVRDKNKFQQAIGAGKADIVSISKEYEHVLVESLRRLVEIKKMVKSSKSALALAMCFGDVQVQLDRLFVPGFLFDQPWKWVQHLPRYLDAVKLRLEKAPQKAHQDRSGMLVVKTLWDLHSARLEKEGEASFLHNHDWLEYRWMLEELRVSLFAQTLKTAVPVSEKRLKKHWAELNARN